MNTQDLCLGVLHLGDASGYEIKQTFERALSHFQSPSYGSIYPALRKLQSAGWVTQRIEDQDKRPAKKIYSLTHEGRSRFLQVLSQTEPQEICKSDFVLLAFFAHLLSTDQLAAIVQQHLNTIEMDLEKLQAIQGREDLPPGMRFSIDYGIEVKQARLKFVRKHLSRLLQEHQHYGDPA
ncbi:MAG TPA: hypothetical protein DD979_12705 [Gammaproteobacteria bacterium]|jgi:DNA-binding PadR family transcriptional regulator|nr:hypothetical protein [Gammaproteobacteria bacterium]